MNDFFNTLGIEATKEEKEIKKAYRDKLHTVNPEDDPNGFKILREAYEEALKYARQKEDEKEKRLSLVEDFIFRCEQLYNDFYRRIDEQEWESLFSEDICISLESGEEVRQRFLVFLMEHFRLPAAVWKKIDRTFSITGNRNELLELFPEPYVDFLLQVVRYNGALNYELFEGEVSQDIDDYIEHYHKLRQYADLGMQKEAWQEYELMEEKYTIYHPYTKLEKARLLYSDEEREKKEVKIGIGICTFKREKYVERNMKVLKENLLNNENALSYGHLSVCISDNGGTLVREKIEDEHIRIVKNKNLGGVGGFTRTMFEHMRDDSITHVLLMDDDAVISPEAIERTYTLLTLLKEKYRMAVIGGSLLREDLPTLQYECGACWNDGDIVANNHNFDMTQLKNVVINEQIQKAEYTGWWYSCIPVPFIKEMHYPLPFFIHRDDIEYGLRANGQFIFLNGITIWHEAFENKLPGFLEYYDVRNLAITNAIHNPQFAAKDFKKMLFVQVSSNIGKYRYKYVDLNLKGAVDFLRGFKWFYNADTLGVHDGLKKYNYQSMPAEEFIGHNGIKPEDLDPCGRPEAEPPCKLKRILIMLSMNGHFLPAYKNRATKVARPNPNIYDLFRCNEVVYADAAGNAICVKRSRIELLKAYIKMLKVFRLIDLHYDKVCEEYRKNHSKLESKDFWSSYLELKEVQNKEM